jgi:hypothetical protein
MLNIELNINGKAIPVTDKVLREIVRCLPDTDEYREIYDDLARHPCADIRTCVAVCHSLSTSTFETLKRDADADVLYWLMLHPMAGQLLTQEDLNRMIELNDVDLNEIIVQMFEGFHNCDPVEILRRILANADPHLCIKVADYVNANPEACVDLLTDPDPYIRKKLEICSSLI